MSNLTERVTERYPKGASARPTPIPPGSAVFTDDRPAWRGTVESFGRSRVNPWKVYFVRRGDSVVEVHPDRIVEALVAVEVARG